ncbi:MAG: hypothetical protein H0V52_04805 [Acidimicrobiia bacterium]|jgi:hypothetical protein|nr:hypothetical protein [Acidimicrobiia bacterium]
MSATVRRVVTGAVLLLALGGFVYAFSLGQGSTDIIPTGDAVEQLVPPQGSQVLRQSEIGIDLAPEWTGVLQINGVEIPEDQLRRVPAQNQVFFTPGPGREIEELPPGPVNVVALIWRPVAGETREDADTVRWSFQVA